MQVHNNSALIKLMQKKSIYFEYLKYIKLPLLGEVHKDFIEAYREYFKAFDHEVINTSEFFGWFIHSFKGSCDESIISLYELAWNQILAADDGIAEDLLLKFHAYASKDAILTHCETEKFSPEKIIELAQAHIEMNENITKSTDCSNVHGDALYAGLCREGGLKWRLNFLNKELSGLLLGDNVLVFAGVSVGKTKFAISELSYMAQQLTEGCAIYFNNEEEDRRIMDYLYRATLGRDRESIRNNAQVASECYTKRMHGDQDRIKIIDITGKKISFIESKLKKYKPKVCFVDLLSKIPTTNTERHDLEVTQIANEMRRLAKKYCPIVSLFQADSSSMWYDKSTGNKTPKRYLTWAQVSESKVGLPGAFDIMISIGADPQFPKSRFLNIAKTKFGVEGVKKEVLFDGEKCLYLDNESSYI